jgi:hypothetical protein
METKTGQFDSSLARMLLAVALVATLLVGTFQPATAGTQIDIAAPPYSGAFGTPVTVLPNGNIVVTDPEYDAGPIVDVGAVYLYDGATGALISTLTGGTAGDQVGSCRLGYGGVIVLSNGNYVVRSPPWDNGATADAGAVTWGSKATGVSGVVSADNSVVGSTAGDVIGQYNYSPGLPSVMALSNGNYLVLSRYWDNGAAADAGAVTWGSGAAGVRGVVSAANSLVGSTGGDQIGSSGVTALSNGNYVVGSYSWDNGAIINAGAVTWGSGTAGVSGVVSAANSLVGSAADDRVGAYYVEALNDGSYVAHTPFWHNGMAADAGAVIWGSGAGTTVGPVTAENSVRGTAEDGGDSMVWAYDRVNRQLVVGRPADNIVTLFELPPLHHTFLPIVARTAP